MLADRCGTAVHLIGCQTSSDTGHTLPKWL